MKKAALFIWCCAGLCLFGLTVAYYPLNVAMATAPTPGISQLSTPAEPSDTLCHLRADNHCTIINELDLAWMAARESQNPQNGATAVPTYTLISASFNTPLNPATLTNHSFQLHHARGQVTGTVSYISLSRMAVFSPGQPLAPHTTYTASLNSIVQYRDGTPLAQPIVWTFTTAVESEVAYQAGGGMNIYFGDLHSHTGYSDGYISSTPADAYASARAAGLDFFAVTEHGFMQTEMEWQNLLNQADAATIDHQFVAIPGYEYSAKNGHINVFGVDTFFPATNRHLPDTFQAFYDWLVAQPAAFAEFNHPSDSDTPDFNFNDFAFRPDVDQKIVLQELREVDQFFLAMNNGWHLGTLKNRDTHSADWGCCPLMGLVAPNLTRDSVLEAMRLRRTFFVSPSDPNFALTLQANGYWMGSAVPHTPSLNFTITAHDPNPPNKSVKFVLYENGKKIANTSRPAAKTVTWQPAVSAKLGNYYYAEAYYDGWLYPAYSSPIWVEQPPVAIASNPQLVAPGMTVMLHGHGSWDPDGDVLAYHWQQTSGPAVPLAGMNTVQASFIAPNTPGQTEFHLTVVDTGSLSDADNTMVTITDQPFLWISKSGPLTVEPGQLITYTLTVTNVGVSAAHNVVITDTMPANAHYVRGGNLTGEVVSWLIPSLAAGGTQVTVSFVVTAGGGVVNAHYGATCANCVPAVGQAAIVTNGFETYLPLITK